MGSRFFLVLASFVCLSTTAAATPPGVDEALVWLLDQQSVDGGWSRGGPTALRDTAEVLNALRALGLALDPAAVDAQVWLASSRAGGLDDIARRALALAGTPFERRADADLLFLLLEQGDDEGARHGWELALALGSLDRAARARLLSREDWPQLAARVAYGHRGCLAWSGPVCSQRGGYGLVPDPAGVAEPDLVSTALALEATADPFFDFVLVDLPVIREAAIAYLQSRFQPDGGAGEGASSVYETSLAVLALRAARAIDPARFAQASAYLRTQQLPDGSFAEDPYLTALALEVLSGDVPNLVARPALVTINPEYPIEGDQAAIQVTVANEGLGTAEPFSVAVYDGSPDAGGVLIANLLFTSLSGGAAFSQSTPWPQTLPAGQHEIHVVVDPQGQVAESDETDNTAVKAVLILGERDLAIVAGTLRLSPDYPAPGASVTATVRVENLGGADLTGVRVRFYDGDPGSGGVQVGADVVIPDIHSLETIPVEMVLGVLGDGEHDIWAMVDPDDQFPEADEANNLADAMVTVEPRSDLFVRTSCVMFSASNPRDGEVLRISARVMNLREKDATDVLVRIFEGDPAAGGTQVGPDLIVPLVPGFGDAVTQQVDYPTLGRAGPHYFFLVVDPDDAVEETDELNNSTFRAVRVDPLQDLALTAVTFKPDPVEEGTRVLINVGVTNLGSMKSDRYSVRWFDGDPAAGGFEFWGDPQTGGREILPGSTEERFAYLDTEGRPFDRSIFVELSPHEPMEIDQSNNHLSFTVPMVATRPDLAVAPEDISFSPEQPVDGDTVTASVLVRNTRNAACPSVPIELYHGTQMSYVVVATGVIPALGPHGSAPVSLAFTATGMTGDQTFGFWVDRVDSVDEVDDQGNNWAEAPLRIRLPADAAPVNLTATVVGDDQVDLEWTEGTGAGTYGVVGYLAYRDGHLLDSRIDLTAQGTVGASSVYGSYTPDRAVDRKPTTYWRPANPPVFPEWFEVSFPESKLVGEVAVSFFYGVPATFGIEVLSGGSWVPASFTIVGTSNPLFLSCRLDLPGLFDGVRLVAGSLPLNTSYFGVDEIAVYEPWPSIDLEHTDGPMAPGAHTYWVEGLDLAGVHTVRSNEVAVELGDLTPPGPPSDVVADGVGAEFTVSWSPNQEPDLAGYGVYRDRANAAAGERGCLAVNRLGELVPEVNDRDPGTVYGVSWYPGSEDSLTFEFPRPTRIDRMRLLVDHEPYAPYSYRLLGSTDGDHWSTLIDRSRDNAIGDDDVEFTVAEVRWARFVPLSKSASTPAAAVVRVSELELSGPDPVRVDPGLTERLRLPVYSPPPFGQIDEVFDFTNREPRRFRFRNFETHEDEIAIFTDADSGIELARYSGSLGGFTTPPLVAARYRFHFESDYDPSFRSGCDLEAVSSRPASPDPVFVESFLEEGEYHYQVTALDDWNNESTFGFANAVGWDDEDAPAAPTGLDGVVTSGGIELSWDPNSEQDLAGYNLYRADMSGGPLNAGELLQPALYTDPDVSDQLPYSYWVTAVDINGNESLPSAMVTVFPINGLDLAVETTGQLMDIAVFPKTPSALVDVKIVALVANTGTEDTGPVQVAFYDGDPLSGGQLIGEAPTEGNVLVGDISGAVVAWPLSAGQEGTHQIYAVVDPNDAYDENDETNNVGHVAVEVVEAPALHAYVTDVDASGFTSIEMSVYVAQDDGVGVYGLGTQDFTVTEDSAPVDDLEITGGISDGSIRPKADLVFLLDMDQPYSYVVQDFCNTTRGVIRMLELSGVDVETNSYIEGHYGFYPLYLGCMDSGMQPPWDYMILWTTINQVWRPDSRRFIVMVTASTGSYTFENVIAAAHAEQVTVFALGVPWEPLDEMLEYLTSNTGGTWHHFENAMDMVPDLYRSTIGPVAQYSARFTSPRPERDGSERRVDVTVEHSGLVGHADGTYQAPQDPNPDLTFVSGSEKLEPATPSAGETTTFSATVINEGDGPEPARNTVVRLYDGDPAVDGAPVGDDVNLGDLATGQMAQAVISFRATAGPHELFAVVDPDDSVAESVETNNRVSMPIDVPGEDRPELALATSDISFSPQPAVEGDPVLIMSVIHNRGTADAQARVGFYSGDPRTGGRMLGQASTVALAAGGAEPVSFQWTVDEPAGFVDVFVKVDPFDEVPETDEFDNLASRRLEVISRQVQVSVSTDQATYPMQTDVLVDVDLVNENHSPWTGNGRVTVEDGTGNTIADLGTFAETDLGPVGLAGWHARVPLVLQAAPADRQNATLGASLDFTALMAQVGLGGQTLDMDSIRVLEFLPDGSLLAERIASFEPVFDFDPVSNAAGEVRLLAEGTTPAGQERIFYVYFDSLDSGPKQPPATTLGLATRDLVVLDYQDTVYLEADLEQGFGPAQTVVTGKPAFISYGIAVADFDGDGLADVVEGKLDSVLALTANNGDGTFAAAVPIATLGGSSATSFDQMAAADFDADGDVDLAVSQYGYNQQYVLLNDGFGTFTQTQIPELPTGHSMGKAACDLDDDGRLDLVMRASYGNDLWYYSGLGDGTFADPVELNEPFASIHLACVDLDQDGHMDVVRSSAVSQIAPQVLFGNGDGTLQDPQDLTLGLDGVSRVEFGDFDLDGQLDLVGLRWVDDGIYLFQRNGPLDFYPVGTVFEGLYPNGLAVGPFRSSGRLVAGAPGLPPATRHGFVWNTDLYPAGPYAVQVRLDEGAGTVAEGSASFNVTPSWDLATEIAVDRLSYGANVAVGLEATVELGAGNAPLVGAQARLAVLDPASAEIWSQLHPLAELQAFTRTDLGATFDTGQNPPGTYTVQLELLQDTTVLASDQTSFGLRSCATDGDCLVAAVTASPQPVDPNGVLTVAYDLNNQGNLDLAALASRVVVTTPAQDVVLAEALLAVDLPMGQALPGSVDLPLALPADGTYLAIFQADYGAGWVEAGYDSFIAVTADADGDGYPSDVDCDDSDPQSYPGAPELCDAKDNDCDLAVDEDLGQTTCGLGACTHTVDNCVGGIEQVCDPVDGTTAEACDLIDNDCDGDTDEELGQTTCGLGACTHTVDNCVGGVEQVCDPQEGATPESCDLIDNDCDGDTDEELGQTTCGAGACTHTVDNCVGGVEQVCDPADGATAEACDLIDNDCDGDTDEELGETTCGVGACSHTVDNCIDGVAQTCDPLESASVETCDLMDNDCDGMTDEDLGSTMCGVGACLHTVENCIDGVTQTCDPLEGTEPETCDLVDNDCDGDTDEELGQTTCGIGACTHTVDNCVGGVEQVCDPVDGATAEACDLIDNDCDGDTDEELGQTTCGVGACTHAVDNCVGGVEQVCDPQEGASPESCDLMDNDCDGDTDEELGQTTCGLGACTHAVYYCIDGVVQTCDPLDGAAPESCDLMDNDCDGETDEELGQTTCGLGACTHTVDNCVGGVEQVCDPQEGTTAEACDLFDNDCDGDTDEELGQTTCGLGVCQHTVDNCIAGVEQVCDPLEGSSPEECDLLDNDCDGTADEDLGTITCGLGTCEHTVDNCVDGVEQVCDPLEGASDEICDLIDNDCDGSVDEELGATTCGLGSCEHAVDNCISGVPQDCDPLEGSAPEACNLSDDDCDGSTDEDLGVTTCGLGACEHAVDNCVAGVEQVCDPLEGSTEETCDLADNDCDGDTDEVDVDGDGYSACLDDCDDSDPAVNPGQPEIPFNGVDDDCDPATPDEPSVDLPAFDRSVCVLESVLMRNNSLVASYDPYSYGLAEQGEIATGADLTMKNNATVAGDAHVAGDLSMKNNALITGDAHVGGSLDLKNNAWIGGQVYQATGPPPDCIGGYDLASAMAQAAAHNDNATLWADPDIEPYLTVNGGLSVPNNAEVVLPGGTYHLAWLEAGNNAVLSVAPGEQVLLFVAGSFNLHNNAEVRNGPGHPEHLYLLLGADPASGDEVVVRNNVELGLYLFAPYADIVWENNAAIYGGIVCRGLEMENNSEIFQPVIQLVTGGR